LLEGFGQYVSDAFRAAAFGAPRDKNTHSPHPLQDAFHVRS
jgi:hypothetical protein